MTIFVNFAFLRNITKKRIKKELRNIEKKNKLNNNVSTYFEVQWDKYTLDKTICYLNIPKNMRTVNSIEIFNLYFHRSCNRKGLVTIYELTDTIKEKFKNTEFKLINDEKKKV